MSSPLVPSVLSVHLYALGLSTHLASSPTIKVFTLQLPSTVSVHHSIGGLVAYSVFEATFPRGHCVLSRLMEISLSPVIVMVMVPLSWARAGKEKIKASIMATTILVIAIFIYPSAFDEPLLTVLGQLFSDKSITVKCYNSPQLLSRPRWGFFRDVPVSGLSLFST
jgi:hypothetical protein